MAFDLFVRNGTLIDATGARGRPARCAVGIRDVVVNGRLAVRDRTETGEGPGRLLRRGA